jgi:hypothetical protein
MPTTHCGIISLEDIEETFAKKSAQNKSFAIRDLVNLKYKDGEDIK